MVERVRIEDPNEQQQGNAPRARKALGGIQNINTPRLDGGFKSGGGIGGAMAGLGAASKAFMQKQDDAAFVEGQLAFMSGKTEDQVRSEGNEATMAGYITLGVGNSVTEWHTSIAEGIPTQHFSTDPEAFRADLAAKTATMLEKVGDDPMAREIFAKGMVKSQEKLIAAQQRAYSEHVRQKTMSNYTNGLLSSGDEPQTLEPIAGVPVKSGPGTNWPNNSSGYRGYAAANTPAIIQIESGGRADARNPHSSAGGVGQFIDSTWMSTIRKYRPDLVKGRSKSEILALKFNKTIATELTVEHTAQNARGLAAKGLAVNPGSLYVAHFAGLGGARRIYGTADNKPISAALTPSQMRANRSIVYKNGRQVTVGEFKQWANNKMAKAAGAKIDMPKGSENATAPTASVGARVLMNPGLSPGDHRIAVTNALVQSLQAGDDGLYNNAGGIAAMNQIGATPQQVQAVTRAYEAYTKKKQGAYDADYESDLNDLMDDVRSGDLDEAGAREALKDFNEKYDKGDNAAKALHKLVEATLDKNGEAEAKNLLQTDPSLMLEMNDIYADVRNGEIDAEEATELATELGDMTGASRESVATAVKAVLAEANKRDITHQKAIATAAKAAATQRKKDEEIENLLSTGALRTASKEKQERGIEMLRERLTKHVKDNVAPADQEATLIDNMAKSLVKMGVPDRKTAARMRTALLEPIDKDGNPTPGAQAAIDFYLRMKVTHGASNLYMAEMFKDDPATLDYLRDVEELHAGDGDLAGSMAQAQNFRENAVEKQVYTENLKRVNTGELRTEVKETILDNTGRTDTWMNNIMNTFNTSFDEEFISAEQYQQIMSSSRFEAAVDAAVRTQTRITPNASQAAIKQRVVDQIGTAGRFVGGSFIMTQPGETTLHERMGLNSTEPGIENKATISYLNAHGAEVFGQDVWDDIGAGFLTDRPEVSVQVIGDMLRITPRSGMYAPEEGLIFDSNTSNPEARVVMIPAKTIGTWYNGTELATGDEISNMFVDIARPVFGHEDRAQTRSRNSGAGSTVQELLQRREWMREDRENGLDITDEGSHNLERAGELD